MILIIIFNQYLRNLDKAFKYFKMSFDKEKNPVQIEYGDLTVVGFIIRETRNQLIIAEVQGIHEKPKILNKDFIIEISPLFATPTVVDDNEDVMFN